MTNSTQPEALRLAGESDNDEWIAGTKQWQEEAAKELRRLHEELKKANEQAEKFERLWYLRGDLNEELLEALKEIVNQHGHFEHCMWAAHIARAAIAKATGEQA